MYIRNSSGPSTDPCGTPLKTSTQSDRTPLIPTFCFLPFSHSVIQSRILPQMPWLRILRISLLYGTLSKALAKSKNTISTFSPISIQPVTLSRNSKRLVMGGGTGGYRGYMYPPPFLEVGYKRVHSVKVCVYPVVR